MVWENITSKLWLNFGLCRWWIATYVHRKIANLPVSFSVGADCCKLQNENPIPLQCQEVIEVPKNDPVYAKRGQTCINFNRAPTSFSENCPLNPATFVSTTSGVHWRDCTGYHLWPAEWWWGPIRIFLPHHKFY